MKHTDECYEFFSQLFRAHDAETPKRYAREAYKRTTCGVWTTFLPADGKEIPSADLTPEQDTIAWVTEHCIGIRHGSIAEGGYAGYYDDEFSAPALILPFSDMDLAICWENLERQVDEVFQENPQ